MCYSLSSLSLSPSLSLPLHCISKHFSPLIVIIIIIIIIIIFFDAIAPQWVRTSSFTMILDHITKSTHTHTHTLQNPHIYTQPHITKPTHTHNHTIQNAHIYTTTQNKTHTYTHPQITKPTHTHNHTLQN